jgi:hypothetical protein
MTKQNTKQSARRNARRQLWNRWDEYAARVVSWEGVGTDQRTNPQIAALRLSSDASKSAFGRKIAGNERLQELAGWSANHA